MTVTINAVTSTGLVQTSDGSGVLKVQSNGVTTNALAWVNFNGTSSTPITPRANYNVGSITKNGTGDYTLNFTSSLTDANYSVVGSAQFGTSGGSQALVAVKATTTPYTTSSVNIVGVRTDTAVLTDFVAINVAIFGN